jgi:hypothetical protein
MEEERRFYSRSMEGRIDFWRAWAWALRLLTGMEKIDV